MRTSPLYLPNEFVIMNAYINIPDAKNQEVCKNQFEETEMN